MDDPTDRIYIDPESEAWVSRVTVVRAHVSVYGVAWKAKSFDWYSQNTDSSKP